MILEYLNTSVCLTVAMGTLATTYAMNTIRNNVANNIKAKLEKGEKLTLDNFDVVKCKIGIVTKTEFYVYSLGIVGIIQLLIALGVYAYSQANSVPFNFLHCCESIFLSLFVTGILVTALAIYYVFTAPEQNLFTKPWDL